MVRAINEGTLPAPYNSVGLAGRKVELVVYDETGGGTKQVTELRNKVQKEGVDVVVGYISSGSCAAIARVAEELRVLTLLTICGTPRIFEELVQEPKYLFRIINHSTGGNVGAARYVVKKLRGEAKDGYMGINQNYAWGQDAWRDFNLAMQTLAPEIKPAKKQQFPKLFSGQYGTEISVLLRAKQKLVHSSLWGGDLEAFIAQGTARGLFKRKKFILTVGEITAHRLGNKFPKGQLARGPYGMYAAGIDTALNNWFQSEFRKAVQAAAFVAGLSLRRWYPGGQVRLRQGHEGQRRQVPVYGSGDQGAGACHLRHPRRQGQDGPRQGASGGHLGPLGLCRVGRCQGRGGGQGRGGVQGRVREPAGRGQCGGLGQGRHEGRQVRLSGAPV